MIAAFISFTRSLPEMTAQTPNNIGCHSASEGLNEKKKMIQQLIINLLFADQFLASFETTN